MREIHIVASEADIAQFTTTDLSDIARSLDEIEASVEDKINGRPSTNMDDTGT